MPNSEKAPQSSDSQTAAYPQAQGIVVSQDNTPQDTDYGPNFEKLKELEPELVAELYSLITQYKQEGLVARRNEIRRCRQARLYWQGIQQIYWGFDDGNWHMPFGSGFGVGLAVEDEDSGEQPRFAYVTNIYLGFGLNFVSVITQDVPGMQWYPDDPNDIDDIEYAKAASDVVTLLEQWNNPNDMLSWISYYDWNDGKVGAYVRWVTDGESFGFQDEDELTSQDAQMSGEMMHCAGCGTDVAADQLMVSNACPNCGRPFTQDDLKSPQSVQVPVQDQTQRLPNGRVIVSFAGSLELNTPIWAKEQSQFPWLQWQLEIPRSKLKASYPNIADKLTSDTGGQTAEDVYARLSRLTVAQGLPYLYPGDVMRNLLTFMRTWIRPASFYDVEDKGRRDKLLQLFPKGCYVAFAGTEYCEARNESMDDCWRVHHAYPGDGQSRPSVGDSIVQVQEQYNNLANITQETYEFGIPPTYADPTTLDFDALAQTTVEPAAHYPARARPGMPLDASFFTPPPAQVPPDLAEYRQELAGSTPQFLTGLFPAVWGGESDQKTASGYAQERDQAMGRIGLIWRRIRDFYTEYMELGVECFRQNATDDVQIAVEGSSDQFEAKAIQLSQLRGNIHAHPEADQTFPRLKSQQRAVLQQLLPMADADPVLAAIFHHPDNLRWMRSVWGLTDLVIPDEEASNKALRAIEALLQEAPIQQPQMNPLAPGMPIQNPDGSPVMGPPMPTVEVDPILDNHAAELETIKAWANSGVGQSAKLSNPQGFANVRAYAMQHAQFMAMQAAPMVGPPTKGPKDQSEPPKQSEAPAPNL